MTPRETASVAVHPAAAAVVAFGSFRFDRANGILSRDREEVPLPPRALGVLLFLLDRPGRVVSKQALLDGVWNGAYVTETSLSEAVSLLRQALGDDAQRPLYIQTVHRRGYRFIAPLRPEEPPGPREAPATGAAATRGETGAAGEALPAEPRWPVLPPSTPYAVAAPAPLASAAGALPAAERSVPPRSLRGIAIGAALALLAGGFLAGRLSRPAERPAPPRPTRFAFGPPEGSKLVPWAPSVAVSPDGRRIVYATHDEAADEQWLFERPLGATTSRRIPGTRGAMAPFFSPDGGSIAFFAEGELRRLPLAGGAPVALAKTGSGGSWGSDGNIVIASEKNASLFAVPATGGEPRRLTRPDPARGEIAHWWPQVLPGAEAVVFTVWRSTLHDASVDWLSLRTGERRTLVRGGAGSRWAAGRLLWARPDGAVMAAPLDAAAGRLTGPAAPLQPGVATHPFWGFAQLGAGADTLAFVPAGPAFGQRRLVRFDARLDARSDVRSDGAAAADLPSPPRFYRNLELGPHGMLAATLLDRDRSDVWRVDPRDGALARLTFDGFNIEPVWSPDGEWVAFASNRTGAYNIHRRRADGSAPAELLQASALHQHPSSWSPDGRELLFGEVGPETGFDIWVLDLATRRARPLLRTPDHEIYAVFSPDGRWIAYGVEQHGRWEVMVRSYPFPPDGGGGSWQISVEGGFEVSWRPDGRALLYRWGSDVWEVPVAPEGRELNPGPPRSVLHRDDLQLVIGAPDGGLYAIVEERPHEDAEAREVQVVVGWQGALPR